MRILALLSLLVVLLCNATLVQCETVRSRNTRKKQRRVQERTTFQSDFRIIYIANEFGINDLPVAAETLAFTYNGKFLPRFSNDEQQNVTIDYNDPYERRMDSVEILEVESRRKLSEEEIRNLQFSQVRNLNVFLRVTGSCIGCPSGTKFTNQVQRRRRFLTSKSGKGKGETTSVPPDDGADDSEIPPRDDGSVPSLPIETSPPVDPADLPTEEELRVVYAQEIRKKNLNIFDVLSLDEVVA